MPAAKMQAPTAKVTAQFDTTTYRFLRNELEILADTLKHQGDDLVASQAKNRFRERERGVRTVLRGL